MKLKKWFILLCTLCLVFRTSPVNAAEISEDTDISEKAFTASYSFSCPRGCGVLGEIQEDNCFYDPSTYIYYYCLKCPKCGAVWYYSMEMGHISLLQVEE